MTRVNYNNKPILIRNTDIHLGTTFVRVTFCSNFNILISPDFGVLYPSSSWERLEKHDKTRLKHVTRQGEFPYSPVKGGEKERNASREKG